VAGQRKRRHTDDEANEKKRAESLRCYDDFLA
jgi:hypothetical protein